MADLPASERAYQHLRSAILAGKLKPDILDIRLLGDQMKMSATPVREALARLSAERLVRFVPHHGYMIVRLTAERLEHLYELSELLAEACLRRVEKSPAAASAAFPSFVSAYAEKLTTLLHAIAEAQANRELLAQIESVNGRLFLARQAETHVFDKAEVLAEELVSLWTRHEHAQLRSALADYHASRTAAADSLARILDASPDTF